MTSVGARLARLQQRLDAAIQEKRFYEANQIYKTIYFRCITRKNYSEALEYLYTGADFLLTHKQWESGTELSFLMLEVYAKSKIPLDESHLNQICILLNKMHPSEDRTSFIQKVSTTFANEQQLMCIFNEKLARLYWREGCFSEARCRIMLSYDGYTVGSFLIALHQRYGLKSEIDLFITQAVLQYLCMQKPPAAVLTFYTYTRGHPRLEPGPPFDRFPLLNFLWFLMLAIEEKSTLSVFTVLCEQYSPQIERDSTYTTYLNKIGQLYFGVKAPNNQMNSLFSNLFKMFSSPDEANSEESREVNNMDASTSRNGDTSSHMLEAMRVEDVD